ncbi:hypothetical protein B0J11DRAFT_428193 [Dendryphion nanum]|uniref:Histone-lysine N-methyltransferase, H3 lysine-4 specific n=1 Tax=Dendryphion nanum TaxID=256645 RepID=A0A9P9IU32_9PLEO|nr:hypothetical protein B0J11DRAFT_428193 [Dendryphion nanum]
MSYPGQAASLHALTPLTSTDSSPPGKLSSPRSAKPSHETLYATGSSSHLALSGPHKDIAATMTPVHTPPETRIPTRPIDGIMGKRLVYDPLLDPKLDPKNQKVSRKPVYKDIVEKGDPSPPPDPRLAIAGYLSGKYVVKTQHAVTPKCKLRLAPYVAKPYAFDARLSCGPDPSTQIVVTGFDPLIPEAQIRAFFTGFGEVESTKNQVHPDNGSPLGICLIKFRDTPGHRRIAPVKASESAKKAVKEGTNQRIGLTQVTVQLDREGKKCTTLVSKAVAQSRKEEERLREKLAKKSTPTSALSTTDLPANVPKGPSGKGIAMRPTANIPSNYVSKKAQFSHLIETVPIKPRLKRRPYIFIAHQYVPVLGTTIEHLRKRLKNYELHGVRCDMTGYFITFHETRRGEEETQRCFLECNMSQLFTYIMNMECHPYGDPDYERSPSPERAAAQKKRKVEEDRIAQEEADDMELEKKRRAEDISPVSGATELLKIEILEKLIDDIKSRVVGSALLDAMAPDKHVEKRRRLGIPSPQSKEDHRPPTLFATGMSESPHHGTPNSRVAGFAGRHGRKALGHFDNNRMRGKKAAKAINVYGDERRKKPATKRAANVRGLHHMLLSHDDDKDSDDEARSSFTRDTEEQESRPISRAPSTDIEDEESARAHRLKRRRIEAGWGEDSDDEMMDDSHARSLLAHLIHKDPENMAEKELEQVLAILPRSSPIWKKADKALKGFRRLRMIELEADAIFGREASVEDKQEPQVIITRDEEGSATPVSTTELTEVGKVTKKKASVTKPRKKTKKQLLEEAKAAASVEVTELTREAEDLAEVDEPKAVLEEIVPVLEETPEEEDPSIKWGVSILEARPTVEDDLSVVMDIDGWQHLVKDNEDLLHLRQALQAIEAAHVSDPQTWAWKQKQIKHLNRSGEAGVSRTETKIEGYYVPNPTGSARTEGVKKIRESEKSKYLPHRIRVQREREERERRAKNEPPNSTAVVEGFKFHTGSKTSSTANSRANRANNRRLVNDINISKNMSGAEGDAMRFNQLKKRKKLVKFDRSAIHNWGLYAEENISANDMIIEYVGEKVRQRVADLREVKYDMQGVGSSYLFRIDEDTVIDATKMGGIARFINHSCMPNCTAKIIRVENTKRIVIYALRDIGRDEELTYDYKFEREEDANDRIPCLCGSVGCKGFLN